MATWQAPWAVLILAMWPSAGGVGGHPHPPVTPRNGQSVQGPRWHRDAKNRAESFGYYIEPVSST